MSLQPIQSDPRSDRQSDMDLKVSLEELSSDEYSQGDDDDLMNVAVIKQQSPTPSRPIVKSSEVSGNGEVGQKKTVLEIQRPPISREETFRRIRLLREQHNLSARPYLYFKRRSIKWSRTKAKNYNTYLEGLKIVIPLSNFAKIFERIIKKNRKHCRSRSMTRSYSRSLSRSRSRSCSRSQSLSRSRSRSPHSASQSPDLICLDDTENEESPEKFDPPPRVVVTPEKEFKTGVIAPPTHFEPREKPKAPPVHTENGSSGLEEFLMLKDSNAIPKQAFVGENDYELANISASLELQQEVVNRSPIQESLHREQEEDILMEVDGPMKRRRSVTPPENAIEKRSKPDSTETLEEDDSSIHFLTVPEDDAVMEADQQEPQMLHKESVAPASNSDPTTQQRQPGFKLSSPYSLTVPDSNDQAVNLAAPSYSLDTPTPTAVPMEIYYPQKLTKITSHQGGPPHVNIAQAQHPAYSYPKTHSPKVAPSQPVVPSLKTPYPQKTVLAQKVMAPAAVHQVATPIQEVAAADHHAVDPSHYIVHTQHVASSPHLTLPPASPQLAPKQHPTLAANPSNFVAPQQPRRSETVSTQTQEPEQSLPRQKTSIDLNNSDANFHQRVKELYTEMDSIIKDKVKTVPPDFCSYSDERERVEADLKTLDKLIAQKEDEYNRLLHLRCVKEELRGRLERKQIVSVIKDMLPPLLSKSCSTVELQEIHSMLLEEETAPIPSKNGPSAIERCLTSMEQNQTTIRLLKGVLGIKQQDPPIPLRQFEEQNLYQLKRNSLPGRQVRSRDLREMEEDPPRNSREQSSEMPPAKKRAKLDRFPPEMTNSMPNLSHSSYLNNKLQSKGKAPVQSQSSLDTHYFENESTLKPLFNSSPMVNRQTLIGQPCFDLYSSYRNDGDLSRTNVAKSQISRRRVESTATMNGTDVKSCSYCGSPEGVFKCPRCQNQSYCSRECQMRDWNSHWETCGK
ncbi:uncharacterized protein [Drosophila bipectinata]|uniref:uncharacterized protein isoform X1 n=2 Tax=Drosophila bipectinata TaxID=42026 RepID=UPI001C897FDF|nr:uncharacterized protein LOC108132761 isoform X1 [Drosophila bipectinata]